MIREPEDMVVASRATARALFDMHLDRVRADEIACAHRFLTEGHDGHAAECRFGAGDACSRTYNAHPYAEARPEPEADYEGTGIGVLYGLTPAEDSDYARRLHVSLAGWTIEHGTPESTVRQDVPVSQPRADKHTAGPRVIVTTYSLREDAPC